MEFERSIFKAHKNLLRTRFCGCCLNSCQLIFAIATIHAMVNLGFMHYFFVNHNEILSKQLGNQLKYKIYRE